MCQATTRPASDPDEDEDEDNDRPPEYFWDMGLLAPGDREPPEGMVAYLARRKGEKSDPKRSRCDAGSSKLISDDKPDDSPPPKMPKL